MISLPNHYPLTCSQTSYNLPDEFTPDIYNEGKSALDQLSWDDKYWNGVNVPNRILCEINLEDTQFWTDDKQQDLDDFLPKTPTINLPETPENSITFPVEQTDDSQEGKLAF